MAGYEDLTVIYMTVLACGERYCCRLYEHGPGNTAASRSPVVLIVDDHEDTAAMYTIYLAMEIMHVLAERQGRKDDAVKGHG
jgi:hypothetical protein